MNTNMGIGMGGVCRWLVRVGPVVDSTWHATSVSMRAISV